MAVGDRNDPYAQFNFLVDLDGLTIAGFTEVSGIMAESDVIEYREGNETPTVRKLAGLLKFGNITCKRGYTQNNELWNWRKTTLDGLTQRRDGTITLRDEAQQAVMRWSFSNGWVSKYEGASLNSTSNEVAIESIEIVHEGLTFELA